MSIRKTIRFYDDDREKKALALLESHREYGYSCEREMIVDALLKLQSKEQEYVLSADTIADKVVEQLKQSGMVVGSVANAQVEKNEDGGYGQFEKDSNDALDDALGFIDLL